jgi:hypothetical protein
MRKIGKTARPRWFVSLPQAKSKKPEISASQAVCDVVSTAPPSRSSKLSTFGCFFFGNFRWKAGKKHSSDAVLTNCTGCAKLG